MFERGAPALLILSLLWACNSAPDKPDRDPPPPPQRLSAAAASATAPSASASAAPLPSQSAGASSDAGALAGVWEGRYDAQKATMETHPKIKTREIGEDDGKRAAGPGTLEITIGRDGEVRGKGTGALGAVTITGEAKGVMLSTSVMPDDIRSPTAMSGTLIGELKGGVFHATLRVAGPNATIIRYSKVELKKK